MSSRPANGGFTEGSECLSLNRPHARGVKPQTLRTLRAAEAARFGKDAAQSLKRHTGAGRLAKPNRGLYIVSEPSEPSEPQVSTDAETDTGLWEVSETEDEEP